jgi:phosphate starvation-inducible PhoH-like protein
LCARVCLTFVAYDGGLLVTHCGIISLILRHTFSPLNNTRLSHLCGPTDEHLRTIEVALDIRIAHRHEQFKVEGPRPKPSAAWTWCKRCTKWPPARSAAATVQLMLSGDGSAPDRGRGPSLSTRRADLKPRSKNQALYLDNIAEHDITFGIGPAGTGKTYLAVAAAVDALQRSAVQRIMC